MIYIVNEKSSILFYFPFCFLKKFTVDHCVGVKDCCSNLLVSPFYSILIDLGIQIMKFFLIQLIRPLCASSLKFCLQNAQLSNLTNRELRWLFYRKTFLFCVILELEHVLFPCKDYITFGYYEISMIILLFML